MCKHIVYAAIKMKLTVMDDGYKTIGANPKRGRKKLAQPALVRQPDDDILSVKKTRKRKANLNDVEDEDESE
jgi:hypothetical protein